MVMRRFGMVVGKVLLASFVAAAMVAITSGRTTTRSATAIVPAYFYPNGVGRDLWNRLASDAGSIHVEAILNPASGPGTKKDPNYVAVVNNLRIAGGSVFGYVSTQYGNRDMAAVTKDINTYIEFYNINGIFIDEMANNTDRLPYYEEIYHFIKGLHSDFKVIGNPGMAYTLESYLAAADALVIFEGSGARHAYFRPLLIAPWVLKYPPDRFANIVYAATSETDLLRALDKAARAHAGSVYITDGELPNPYQGLPPYWAREVAAIRARHLTAASMEKRIPLEESERQHDRDIKAGASRRMTSPPDRVGARSP
jgi:Spherulation-specific family 4